MAPYGLALNETKGPAFPSPQPFVRGEKQWMDNAQNIGDWGIHQMEVANARIPYASTGGKGQTQKIDEPKQAFSHYTHFSGKGVGRPWDTPQSKAEKAELVENILAKRKEKAMTAQEINNQRQTEDVLVKLASSNPGRFQEMMNNNEDLKDRARILARKAKGVTKLAKMNPAKALVPYLQLQAEVAQFASVYNGLREARGLRFNPFRHTFLLTQGFKSKHNVHTYSGKGFDWKSKKDPFFHTWFMKHRKDQEVVQEQLNGNTSLFLKGAAPEEADDVDMELMATVDRLIQLYEFKLAISFM